MRARWEAWKDRNTRLWDFVTTPLLILIVAILKAWKWAYRLRRF